MNCKNLKLFWLEFKGEINDPRHNEKSNFEKLLVSSRAFEIFHLDSFFVELLSADAVPNGFPVTLNCLWSFSLGVDFGKMSQTSYALQLIKSSPNLSKLDNWVRASSDNAEAVLENLNTQSWLKSLFLAQRKIKFYTLNREVDSTRNNAKVVLKYLDTPSCLKRPLDKLEYVAINDFKSSKAELLLVKLLLSRSPSLLRMYINQEADIDINVVIELMSFCRASPRAEKRQLRVLWK